MLRLLFISTVLLFAACDDTSSSTISADNEESTPQETVPIAELELSEKSELAELMRVMESHADSVAAVLRRGDDLPPPPVGIDRLSSATPTKDMHIDANTFPVFVEEYQEKIEALYATASTERQNAYNMVIQTCANCHYTHCPGPLMKIEKMYVEEL